MHQAQAIIERVRRVSATTQHIDVAVQKPHYNIAAGQLFLARMTESLDPYLREPWTPVRREGSTVIVERPVTQNFAPGDLVNLLGPVGKPIPLRDSAHTLLLVAYDSAPTGLLMLAETALAKGQSVALALVGAALNYSLEALPQEIEIIRGNADNAWPNQSETLRWADQIVAVAPPPFDVGHYTDLLNALREVRIEVPANYIYGLFQPPMPCGVGACQACLVRCGREEISACVEGPAFDLLSVAALTSGARE
jgi:dihydroorotate dehydrogenase electron transfer subunit